MNSSKRPDEFGMAGKKIDRQIELAAAEIANGRSKHPGRSYEQGVRNALEWVRGDISEAPMGVKS